MSLSQLTLADIGSSVEELEEFHDSYSPFFETDSEKKWSQAYLHSTFVCEKRRNIANRARSIPNGNAQNMHHFISNASWEERPLINKLQGDIYSLIGSSDQGALILDESGIPKKGSHSVGVDRQYCGALGKVDNCQVGVFLAYSSAKEATLIDRRLYIPFEWFDDILRLKQAGIPSECKFQTKGQLAQSMILSAISNGIGFDFVGGDSAYGNLPWLRDFFAQRGILYFLEASSDTLVWQTRPKISLPRRRKKRGRPPTKPKLAPNQPSPVSILQIAAALDDSLWQSVFVREGEKQPLEWEFCALRVVTRRNQLPGPEEWLILRRSLGENSDIKSAFSNAPPETSISTHASRMARRYWVERAIQIGKGGTGLDEYEVRSYKGWHHQMTMTLLAMLFLLRLRIKLSDKAPMLTIEDVREILSVVLPKRAFSHAEVLELIEEKHKARAAAKKSHYRSYNNQTQKEVPINSPQRE
jgi:SRSO17 transposase